MSWRILPALLFFACGDDPALPPMPDVTPIEVAPAMYLSTQALMTVKDGDLIDLVRPPQGGYVLFVGARIKGTKEKVVELRGRLRMASGMVIGQDGRTVTLQPAADDP